MLFLEYVVGGRAMITPEHAPARTVAIQEDVREVNLTRYGGDIEMNLSECCSVLHVSLACTRSSKSDRLCVFAPQIFSYALRTPARNSR